MATRQLPRRDDFDAPAIIDADPQSPIYGDDTDTESAWSQWGEDLKNAQVRGVIRVAKIPTSEDGTPNLTKKGQVQLMSVPHDQYDLDGLLEEIRRKFMKPGETIAIRLTGMRQGGSNAGVVPFNRIVMVSRGFDVEKTADSSQLGEVMAEMRKSQEAQAAMMERLFQSRPELTPVPVKPGRDVLESMTMMIGALTPLIAPVITGLMNRPKDKSDLASLIEGVAKLQALSSGKSVESDNDNDNSMGSIIKAVAPAGMNLLAALAARTPSPPPMMPAPVSPPAPRALSAPVDTLPNPAPRPAQMTPDVVPPTQEMQAMLATLKPVLEQTNQMARDNANPTDVAKLLSDMLPEDYDEQLYKLVETPSSFQRLALIDKGVREYATWYEALRVALLALYSEDADDTPSVTPVPESPALPN